MTPPPIPGLNGAADEKAGGEHETPEIAKLNRERQFRGAVEREVFHVLPAWVSPKVSVPVATRLQDAYEFVAAYAINWAEMPFYLAIVLCVLTLGSWITHARYPGRRNGKPIPLT